MGWTGPGSAANTHDSLGLMPLVQAVPAVRSRRGPRRRHPAKLHAKGYDDEHLRAWLRDRRLAPHLARRGVDTSTRLGRHRWQVESTIAHLFGYRRLTLRYEHSARLFTAFLTLAAALTCYKKLTRRVIQNSTVKIANGPLTCADAGRGGADKGLLNNPSGETSSK